VFVGIDPRTDTAQLSASRGKSKTDYLEARLTSSNSDSPFTWLLGANYTKLRSSSTGGVSLEGIAEYIDANPGEFGGQPSSVIAPDDQISREIFNERVKEVAAFGELSYRFDNGFKLTAGGRLFQYRSSPRLQFLPNAFGTPPFDYQPGAAKESGFIPKLSASYEPNRNFMVYALYSEGFRIGGVNVYSARFVGDPDAPQLPLQFESDSTKNYEIGARLDLFDRKLSLDVTGYYINWQNVQVRLFTPGDFLAYTTNGGGANVDGIELAATFRPTNAITLTTSISHSDALLSKFLPDSFAPGGGYRVGSRLPGASEWTMANSVNFDLRDSPLRPRIGIAHRYLSEAPVAFGATLEKGGYHIFDLNASAEVFQGVELGLFAKNIFNKYGILNAPFSFAGSVTRPRTVGAVLRYSLK
jgi:outer membrane receptor protein involved in Fe transport